MELKCKMCGSDLYPEDGARTAICEVCGSEQTLPQADTPKKINLFNKANHYRLQKRFDEAAKQYRKIIEDYPDDGEAYWCLLLCEYGIEYVDDKKTKTKIPTCNRTLKTPIFDQADYKTALKKASKEEKALYEKEAKEIDRLQKKILAISQKEEPYDIFICFKDTDDKGKRTKDSQYATLIYDRLTQGGYRVFFSRVTLKSKAGSEYEPLIYSALQSAKVMIAVGTKTEHMEAVWVRNEWSRYLGFMEEDVEKAIVPCLKGMDPYDMPDELQDFQALDMGELDFFENLLRSIDNKFGRTRYVAPAPQPAPAAPVAPVASAPQPVAQPAQPVMQAPVASASPVAPLLQRVMLFLEDKDYKKADEYCEKVLDNDPFNGTAYLYKAVVELKLSKKEDLKDHWEEFVNGAYYAKVTRYADAALQKELAVLGKSYEEKQKAEEAARKVAEAAAKKAEAERQKKLKELEKKRTACNVAQKQLSAGVGSMGIGASGELFYVGKFKNAEDLEKKAAISRTSRGLADGRIVKTAIGYSISSSTDTAYLLYANGTISSCGASDIDGDAKWVNLADVAASNSSVVGLKKDGTVVVKSLVPMDGLKTQKDLAATWKNIVAVDCGNEYIIGLKADGTVEATRDKTYSQVSTRSWEDIVAISVGYNHTVGLKADGTVVAAGANEHGECDVSAWTDIVAVSAGLNHTAGLKADGTVVATGENKDGQCNVSSWKDVVAVKAGYQHTVALKKDGSVVTVGWNHYGQDGVKTWKLFDSVDTLAKEIQAQDGLAEERKKKEAAAARKAELEAKKAQLAKWKAIVAKQALVAPLRKMVSVGGGTIAVSTKGEVYAAGAFANKSGVGGLKTATRQQGDYRRQIVGVSSYHSAKGDDVVAWRKDGEFVFHGDDAKYEIYTTVNNVDQIALGEKFAGVLSKGKLKIYGKKHVSRDCSDFVFGGATFTEIAAGQHIIGLKKDGTVAAAYGPYNEKVMETSNWSDIVAVSASGSHTLGLRKDGTVVAAGDNKQGACNVKDWKDIVFVSAGEHFSVGVKADGTVVRVGRLHFGYCDVSNLTDVVAAFAGNNHVVAVKTDGSVVAVGESAQIDGIKGWKLFDNLERIEQEIEETNEELKKEEEERRAKYLEAVKKAQAEKALEEEKKLKAQAEHKAMLEAKAKELKAQAFSERAVLAQKASGLISAGAGHTVAVNLEGTVKVTGSNEKGQSDLADWKDIVKVSAGQLHTVGLKADGTVVATGYDFYGQCKVSGWKDIVDIAAGHEHTIGLKKDGTVVGAGWDSTCSVSSWRDIVAIATGSDHTVGLKKDGTVLALGNNFSKQCDVQGWTDIVGVAAGCGFTAGLTVSGRVVLAGKDMEKYLTQVSGWKDIVAIYAGFWHLVGLRSNGTLVVAGGNVKGECNVSTWKDIVSVACGGYYTIGLTAGGDVLGAGINMNGESNVKGWKLFTDLNALDKERKEAKEKAKIAQEKAAALMRKIAELAPARTLNARVRDKICASNASTVGVTMHGKVLSTHDFGKNLASWTYIQKVYHRGDYIIGLKPDGTIVTEGYTKHDKERLESVTNVVDVAVGAQTLLLKRDGTLAWTGMMDVGKWRDITAVAISSDPDQWKTHALGLKKDGTVVAAGNGKDGQCAVEGWRGIVEIAAGEAHSVGLRKDGTVVATGRNAEGQCDVSGWTDVIAIAAYGKATLGLKKDGKVLLTGSYRCRIGGWQDVVAISMGALHAVGVKKDGTVLADAIATINDKERLNVGDWKLFKNIATYEKDATEAKANMSKGFCPYCGGKFKGVFTKVCSQCDKKKDY